MILLNNMTKPQAKQPDIHRVNRLDYNLITDGIFVGTNMCCQTHFDESLRKKGISADVSLEKERMDSPFGIDFYVWIPVEDHTAPTQDQLQFGVYVLEKFVEMKKKVYLHCQHGHGRAPTMMAAYLIKNKKMLPTEAIIFVKERRPPIHLDPEQEKALEEFRSNLNKNPAERG